MDSDTLDNVKFEQGPAKCQLTLQEAEDLGAGVFQLRLHIFTEDRDRSRVFLSVLPGTLDDLSPRLKAMADRDSFPTLSYELWDPEGDNKFAMLYPPAGEGKKFGVYVLGVINTLALPLATEALVISVDPKQYLTAVRYLDRGCAS